MEFTQLAGKMEEALAAFSFRPYTINASFRQVAEVRVWRLRTWAINRAAALLRYEGNEAGKFARSIKMPLGKEIGYFPFFYPLGLQLIVYGRDILLPDAELDKYVDKIDTQTVILQSLFVIDSASMEMGAARTWAQFISGKYQRAIDSTLNSFLESFLE